MGSGGNHSENAFVGNQILLPDHVVEVLESESQKGLWKVLDCRAQFGGISNHFFAAH